MARPLAPLLLFFALLASAPSAWAEVPSQCREAFVESQFDEARECIDGALDDQQGDPAAVAELFAYRAATLTALSLDDEARESMEVVLALVPDWEASDPLLTSPRILDLVAAVRQAFDVSAGHPTLEREVPAAEVVEGEAAEVVEGEALVVRAHAPNVEAPLEAVLMVRAAGQGRFRAVPLRGRPGGLLTARVPLEPGERVDYYLAVLVPGGWEGLRRGSPEAPFRAEREATGPGAPPPSGGSAEPGLGARYWWVWTLLAVAAAGGAVGLGLGLTLGGDETGSVRLHFP